jgi:hypothetical protein
MAVVRPRGRRALPGSDYPRVAGCERDGQNNWCATVDCFGARVTRIAGQEIGRSVLLPRWPPELRIGIISALKYPGLGDRYDRVV